MLPSPSVPLARTSSLIYAHTLNGASCPQSTIDDIQAEKKGSGNMSNESPDTHAVLPAKVTAKSRRMSTKLALEAAEEDEASAFTPKVLFHGWLHKKSSHVKQWRRRYFCVRNTKQFLLEFLYDPQPKYKNAEVSVRPHAGGTPYAQITSYQID